jgi:hypothetical protein
LRAFAVHEEEVTDLTLLYYTANRISAGFSERVRDELAKAATGHDRVAVSHKPMSIPSVVVGNVQQSIWRVYQNILIAAKYAKTKYVACCEDDSLYTAEHFQYRPPDDTFMYNENRWVITRRLSADGKSREAFYYWRQRTQMAQCICNRALLIETLEEKFAAYPVSPASTDIAKKAGWGEPGRYEKNLHLTPRKRAYFRTELPNITFNHGESLMGRRQVHADDPQCVDLPPWGNANDLWNRIHG